MDLKRLYGADYDERAFSKRAGNLKKMFFNIESMSGDYMFSSPGRAEIIGNHTDHNHGKVIVAAVSCDILAVVKKRDDDLIKICSEGYKQVLVDINNTEINPAEYGSSEGLVRGIAAGLKSRGYEFGGFTAYTVSDIFKGAGVSSSAAFELLVCEIINSLYLGGKVSKREKAVISQYSENNYFGKPCGLLDQMGISLGGFNSIDFKNPEKPEEASLTVPEGYDIVLTNTGGDHANLTEHYAAIRTDMQAVAGFFGEKYLRDVKYTDFIKNLRFLKEKFDSRALLRAFHFYSENDRVDAAAKALQASEFKAFTKIVTASGDSSIANLQNCYVPGSVDQPISLAVRLSKDLIKDGGVRVHGGGFAGTVMAFVSEAESAKYISKMQEVFGAENVFKTAVRREGACQIE